MYTIQDGGNIFVYQTFIESRVLAKCMSWLISFTLAARNANQEIIKN